MSITHEIHGAFLGALGDLVVNHSDLDRKPLSVDLAPPMPPHLRVYMYTLVGGVGTVRPTEYKSILRLPGQPTGVYESFDHSNGRFTLVVGYRADLDVFVLWDASLHPRFTNGTNIQVRDTTVHRAAATGRAEQRRSLNRSSTEELVLACQSWNLAEAIDERVARTGDGAEGGWATSES